MPAAGKTNASRVQINDRIIVRLVDSNLDRTDTVRPSETKTGEGVQVVRVTGKVAVQGGRTATGRGSSRMYYRITTSAGTFNAVPVQTMWLAPEDNAGIKRAHVEALAEEQAQALARVEALEAQEVLNAHTEALEENARREAIAASRLARISVDQVAAWLDRHREQGTPRREWSEIEDARQADHAEALTLHSQDGNVGPDSDTDGGEADMTSTDTQTAAPQNHTGSTVVTILEKVWARIREDHPELPEVVIITGSGEGSKWGHFRADSWKIQEEGATIKRHELFLASEALAKGPGQVVQTMLHEAAHTLSRVRGVQDTSRQGRWHNAQFRNAAAEMGLTHKADKADRSHGFAFVTLTEATKARYADLIEELGREIRLTGHLPVWLGGDAEEDEQGGERMTKKPKTGGDEGERKSGAMKAVCDCEEPVIIRLSDKVLNMRVVRCDDCQELFHRP